MIGGITGNGHTEMIVTHAIPPRITRTHEGRQTGRQAYRKSRKGGTQIGKLTA